VDGSVFPASGGLNPSLTISAIALRAADLVTGGGYLGRAAARTGAAPAPSPRVDNFPNKITLQDFDGWVQERGLYFIQDRDPHFRPLLVSGDPGRKPLDGGLLITDYGAGKYILTSYAWFRQLPEGVPGAIRIFANLISVGRAQAGQSTATSSQTESNREDAKSTKREIKR
jgi:hypothetical protein